MFTTPYYLIRKFTDIEAQCLYSEDGVQVGKEKEKVNKKGRTQKLFDFPKIRKRELLYSQIQHLSIQEYLRTAAVPTTDHSTKPYGEPVTRSHFLLLSTSQFDFLFFG